MKLTITDFQEAIEGLVVDPRITHHEGVASWLEAAEREGFESGMDLLAAIALFSRSYFDSADSVEAAIAQSTFTALLIGLRLGRIDAARQLDGDA